MHPSLRMATCAAAVVLGMSMQAKAAAPEFGIKFGAGATLNAPGDQRSRATVGFALTSEFRLASGDSILADVHYRTVRAEFYEATQVGFGLAGAPNAIKINESVDMRRDRMESIGLTVGYRKMVTKSFGLQGGLGLDVTSAAQEVVGGLYWHPDGVAKPTGYEGLNHTPGKRSIRPGAYVGCHFPITRSFYVDTNVVYLSFKQPNYVPAFYTVERVARVDEKTANKVVLDISAGFRF